MATIPRVQFTKSIPGRSSGFRANANDFTGPARQLERTGAEAANIGLDIRQRELNVFRSTQLSKNVAETKLELFKLNAQALAGDPDEFEQTLQAGTEEIINRRTENLPDDNVLRSNYKIQSQAFTGRFLVQGAAKGTELRLKKRKTESLELLDGLESSYLQAEDEPQRTAIVSSMNDAINAMAETNLIDSAEARTERKERLGNIQQSEAIRLTRQDPDKAERFLLSPAASEIDADTRQRMISSAQNKSMANIKAENALEDREFKLNQRELNEKHDENAISAYTLLQRGELNHSELQSLALNGGLRSKDFATIQKSLDKQVKETGDSKAAVAEDIVRLKAIEQNLSPQDILTLSVPGATVESLATVAVEAARKEKVFGDKVIKTTYDRAVATISAQFRIADSTEDEDARERETKKAFWLNRFESKFLEKISNQDLASDPQKIMDIVTDPKSGLLKDITSEENIKNNPFAQSEKQRKVARKFANLSPLATRGQRVETVEQAKQSYTDSLANRLQEAVRRRETISIAMIREFQNAADQILEIEDFLGADNARTGE